MSPMLENLAGLGDGVLEAPWAAFITQPASLASPSSVSGRWKDISSPVALDLECPLSTLMRLAAALPLRSISAMVS